MSHLVPRQKRADFKITPIKYGRSVMGAPLLYFPAQQISKASGLIFAGTHGDETASISTLSCALRSLNVSNLKHHIILSMNPDGNQLGIRSNANYVDLNRNFPSQNHSKNDTVYRWNSQSEVRDVIIKTASSSSSEPEVKSLCRLILKLKPKFAVSFHEPLACIDDPEYSSLGCWLSSAFDLPLVKDIGYETPGSFGSWCKEIGLPCITVEFPPISADLASEKYLKSVMDLMSIKE